MRFSLAAQISQLKRKSIFGQIVVIVIGVQLLFFGSFIALNLPVATQKNLSAYIHNQELAVLYMLPPSWQTKVLERLPKLSNPVEDVRFSTYVPLIPIAVFLGYVLGAALGLFAAAIYFAVGLVAPTFGVYPLAAGGGLNYYGQPGFGYLIGVVAAAWFAGYATAKRRTSFRQGLAVVFGIASAHLIGLAYLLGACLVSLFVEGTPKFPQWRPWVFEEVRNLTWYPLPYDVLFSLTLVGLGFPFRWLVKTLTAPDIANRTRSQQRVEDLDPV